MTDASTANAAGHDPHDHEEQSLPYNATITDWIDLNPELAIFRVKPDEGQAPEFEPGQFATLAMPRNAPPISHGDDYPEGDPRWLKLWRRAYSIASSPLERDYLEFYVVVVKEGKLTPKLWHGRKDSRIWLDPRIKGEFTLEHVPDPLDKNLLMISTGTGLAPYVSMLKTYRGRRKWKRFIILHGVRLAEDLGYREELMQIAKEDPSVIYMPACTREPAGSAWDGQRGRVNVVLEDDKLYEGCTGVKLDPADTHVFLCGNPDMLNLAEALLHQRGFTTQTKKQPGNIHLERYW